MPSISSYVLPQNSLLLVHFLRSPLDLFINSDLALADTICTLYDTFIQNHESYQHFNFLQPISKNKTTLRLLVHAPIYKNLLIRLLPFTPIWYKRSYNHIYIFFSSLAISTRIYFNFPQMPDRTFPSTLNFSIFHAN